MCLVLRFCVFACFIVIVPSRRGFTSINQDADKLLQDIIGNIDVERQKWTTPHIKKLHNDLIKIKQRNKKRKTTTLRRDDNISSDSNITVEDIKMRQKIRNTMDILNDRTNHVPSFERGDDDPAKVTRRFDEEHKQILRGRSWRHRSSNIFRNRTILVMHHFIHATRYKLPYSQLLRKKYHNVTRYRLGYLFGLLNSLKRQQVMLYNTIQEFRIKVYFLHMHMRIYEKIVRLDVDIKDIIRMVRIIESKRRIESDPKYYDEYYEDETTTTTPPPGVEIVKVTEYTMPKAKVHEATLAVSETPVGPDEKPTEPINPAPGRRFKFLNNN